MTSEIDWKELREKFFRECVELNGEEQLKVSMSPHDLFEWLKKELNIPATTQEVS